jgi:acetoacetyl-[acyl-carrier protein] synthase
MGDERLRAGGLVQAHGTGTPQNRVTESRIISDVATAFGHQQLSVAAIKSYVGHSLGAAAGDQLSAMLGIWDHGWVPGIGTIDAVADDVSKDGLHFALGHEALDRADYALINSKGFGGNNATAALLAPETTATLLRRHHGESAMDGWSRAHEAVAAARGETEAARLRGDWSPIYRFNDGVLSDEDIEVSDQRVALGDIEVTLNTDVPSAWRLDD